MTHPASEGGVRVSGVRALALAATLSLLAGALFAADPPRSSAPKRPAKEIIKEYRSIVIPSFQPPEMSGDEYKKLVEDSCDRMSALALELCTHHPDHKKTAELMEARWEMTMGCFSRYDAVFEETGEWIRHGEPKALVRPARVQHANAAIHLDRFSEAEKLALIRAALDPGSDGWRTVHLYHLLASEFTSEPKTQRALIEEALKIEIPEKEKGDWTGPVRSDAKRLLRALDRVGQTPELAFEDALAGRAVDLADLRGKWVILHGWYAHVWEADKVERDEVVDALRAIRAEVGAERLALVSIVDYAQEDQRQAHIDLAKKIGLDWALHYEVGAPSLDPAQCSWFDRWSGGQAARVLLLDPEGRIAALSVRAAPIGRYLREHVTGPR